MTHGWEKRAFNMTNHSWPFFSTFLAFLSDFGNGSWQDINRSGSFHQTTHSTYPPPARPSTYGSSVHVETISQLCSTLILSNCQISHTNKTQSICEMSPDMIEIEVGTHLSYQLPARAMYICKLGTCSFNLKTFQYCHTVKLLQPNTTLVLG